MAKGLRILPAVGGFLALTWVTFFLSYGFLSGTFADVMLGGGFMHFCWLLAGFGVPLILIKSLFFGGARSQTGVSDFKAKLDDGQLDLLMTQISLLKESVNHEQDLEKHIEALATGFASGKKDLEDSGKELAEAYKGFNTDLDAQQEKLKKLTQNLGDQAQEVGILIEKQTAVLDTNSEKTKALSTDLETITEKTEAAATRVVAGLADPINLVEQRVAQSVDAMQYTIRGLDSMLDEVAEGFDAAKMLSNETRQHISYNNGELAAVVHQTHSELRGLQNALPGQIDVIERMGAMAANKAAELDNSFTHHLSAVVDMGNALEQRAHHMQEAFQFQAGQLNELGAMLQDLRQNTGKEIGGQIRGLIAETQQAAMGLEECSQSAAGMMQAVFAQQKDITGQMMHELSARMERMTGRVQESLGSIERDGHKVEGQLAGMAERVAEMVYGAGHEIIGEIEGRLQGVRQQSDHLAASLSVTSNQMAEEVGHSLAAFDQRKYDLDARIASMSNEAAGMIESQLGDVVGMVLERIGNLRHEMQALGHSFSQVERDNDAAMDQAAEAWYQRVTGSTRQVLENAGQSLQGFEVEVANSLDRIRQTVEQQTEQAVLQSESLADRAASRVSGKMVSLFDTMEERARASEAGVARAEAGLQENMAKTAEALRQMMNSFAADMSETSDSAVSRLITIGREVPELADRMAVSAADALSTLNQTGETYEHQRQQIRGMVRELEEMSGRIEKRVASLDGQVERIGSGLEHESHAIHGHLGQLNKLLQQFRDTGGALTDVIADRVSGLTETTELTSGLVDAVENRLSNLAGVATDNLERAQQAAQAMTAEAEDDLLKLDTLGRETYERWNETRQNMGQSLTQVEAQVAGLHETLESMAAVADQQSAKLSAQSEEAQGRAQRLIDALNEGQKTAFLRTASDLMSKLQDAAIDVDRILQGDLPNEVLRAINSGDRSVSVRRLLGYKGDRQVDALLADMYAQDSDFRTRMNEYMQGCERLLKLALDSDPSRLMHTTVLTADVGKLYLYLRDALGQQLQAA